MKHLHDPATAAEVRSRLDRLRADSPRQWGRMTPPQAVAHLAGGLEQSLGDRKPPRVLMGRVMGWVIKPLALGDDAPMRKNSPTVPELVTVDKHDLDLERERARVHALLDRFESAGPAGCTTHPHSFFGRLVPNEWAVLMYKHFDHHLRQFGV